MAIRVLGICGSMRTPSATKHAVEAALRGARDAGATTEFLDVADAGLPFCDGRDDIETYPLEVQQLKAMLQNAQGIIIGTPEYHNSLTGALKNAIDLCGFEEFEHKMVGLIGVAGGGIGAINAINHLRTIMRGIGAWVVPHQVSISNSDDVIAEDGEVIDEEIEQRLNKLGGDVAKFARLIAAGIIDMHGMKEV